MGDTVVDEAVDAAAELLKVLASPVRLALLVQLDRAPRCVHELVTSTRAGGRAVSQPLVSQHLRVLRTAGLVTGTKRAREIVYRLTDTHVTEIVTAAIDHAKEKETRMTTSSTEHSRHDEHDDHVHGEACGHETVEHDGHLDYVHDGHRHAEHEGHWDEH